MVNRMKNAPPITMTGNTHRLAHPRAQWQHFGLESGQERHHELTFLGIRVKAETLHHQHKLTHQLDCLKYVSPGDRQRRIPLSMWWNRPVARNYAALAQGPSGRGSVTVRPKILKQMCASRATFTYWNSRPISQRSRIPP